MNMDLSTLRTALAEHLLAKPAMPSPYDPHSIEGRAYFAARCEWSDRLRRLDHEIWKLEHPKLVFTRQQPAARALSPAPVRLRA